MLGNFQDQVLFTVFQGQSVQNSWQVSFFELYINDGTNDSSRIKYVSIDDQMYQQIKSVIVVVVVDRVEIFQRTCTTAQKNFRKTLSNEATNQKRFRQWQFQCSAHVTS